MNTIRSLGFLLGFVVLAGCSATFNITRSTDPYHPGLVTYRSSEISPDYQHFISFTAVQDAAGGVSVYFDTRYSGADWMFLHGAALLIDGKPIDLGTDNEPYRDVGNDAICYEDCMFPLNEVVCTQLENASEISFRFIGTKADFDGYLKPKGVGYVHEFMSLVDSLETEGRH